jgi:hypothetical protein
MFLQGIVHTHMLRNTLMMIMRISMLLQVCLIGRMQLWYCHAGPLGGAGGRGVSGAVWVQGCVAGALLHCTCSVGYWLITAAIGCCWQCCLINEVWSMCTFVVTYRGRQ